MRILVLSDEFTGKFVTAQSFDSQAGTLYDVLLGRAADTGGKANWSTQIENNSWEFAVDAILASDEYIGNFGNDVVPGGGRAGCDIPEVSDAFEASKMIVEQVYCRVLQRPVDDGSIAGWVTYLQSNTVKDLVRLLSLSGEFTGNFVIGKSFDAQAGTLYDVLLGRAADTGGLTFWSTQIENNTWEFAVDAILGSGEYIGNFGNGVVPGGGRDTCSVATSVEFEATKVLVEQVYCRVLQRPVDDPAIVTWVNYLQSNTMKDLVRLLSLSGEFTGKFVTTKSFDDQAVTLYDVLLARPADTGGKANWSTQIENNTWEFAVNAILASDEYNNGFGEAVVPGNGRTPCAPPTRV
jgi:hypothetical protein